MGTVPKPTLLSPPDPAAWRALLAAAPGAGVFHTPEWAELWTREWPGARWRAFTLRADRGYAAVLGFIERRDRLGALVASMPYGTYGGPLVRADCPDAGAARRALLAAFARHATGFGVRLAELTWFDGVADEVPGRLAPAAGLTHTRPLERDYAALERRLPHSVRARIRQARESQLVVERVTDAAGVAEYHRLAVHTIERRGGRPKSLALYRRIFDELVPRHMARFDLVRLEGHAIAGTVHLLHDGVALNWLTVSDVEHWRHRPNNLLIASVLAELCAAGFREYNLGGSPPDAAGLIRFKEGWGASRRPVVEARHRHPLLRLIGR